MLKRFNMLYLQSALYIIINNKSMADTSDYIRNLGKTTASNYSVQTRAGNLHPAFPQEGTVQDTDNHPDNNLPEPGLFRRDIYDIVTPRDDK